MKKWYSAKYAPYGKRDNRVRWIKDRSKECI